METIRREALLKEYSEVGSNFRLLTDIRFKLLALLPIAAAATAALKGDSLGITGFGLSLFGLVVTLGLTTYNARNDQLYDALVGRATSIERSLGLPDGAFANRPRPWLDVPLGIFRWSVDHRNGVSTIYAASVVLWSYGVLAPTIELGRHIYLLLGFPHVVVTDPPIWVNTIAFILAIVLTLLGTFLIGKHKKSRAKSLREWAAKAVELACKLPILELAKNKELLSLCVNLSGEKRQTIEARAQFFSNLNSKSLDYYLPTGSKEVTATHIIAQLTDFPADWLFDIAMNRRRSREN